MEITAREFTTVPSNPGAHVPNWDGLPGGLPAAKLYLAYSHDLYNIPGVTNVGFEPGFGDKLFVHFRTEQDRQIGAMILADELEGVKIITQVASWTGGSPTPDDSLWKHQAAIAGVCALPGVFDERTYSGAWANNGRIEFRVMDKDVVEHLDPLIRDRIVGQDRGDGTTRYYDVAWSYLGDTH